MKKFLTWFPRLILLAHAGLLAVLSLDAFESEETAGRNILAFAIHLVPAAASLAALAIAWRWRTVGGLLTLGLAAGIFLMTGTDQNSGVYLLLVAPPVAAGILFILGGNRN